MVMFSEYCKRLDSTFQTPELQDFCLDHTVWLDSTIEICLGLEHG